MRVRQFATRLNVQHRLRSTLHTERGRLVHWAVQLEWLDPDEGWCWVVRYDTSGGEAHRDRNRIAAHEVASLSTDPGVAARQATDDLREKAREYTEAYQAAKTAGREAW